MKKYTVIYRSVLMENLQYAANIAMGYISYFIFIFVFIQLWNFGLHQGTDDMVFNDNGDDMV